MTTATALPALLDVAKLKAELTAFTAAPRSELVTGIKALRIRELAAIAKAQLAAGAALSGEAGVAAITAMTDAIIVALAERAFAKAGAPAGFWKLVAVFAIGGYGRGELNPQSDIDLLVLSADGKPQPWLVPGNTELQALLWDVGFQLGASQRGLSELEKIVKDDFVTATALLEQRLLRGDPHFVSDMAALLERFRRKRSQEYLLFKLDELAKRRAQTGVSLFLMEPNLKTNPGGLRDVQLLRNIAFVLFGSRDLTALEQLEVITRSDLDEVAKVNDHLLRLRSLLHFHHGRKSDVFQLADQLRIAQQLGYQDVSQLRAVEHLMKRHYAAVLHVHQTLELAVSRMRARGNLGRKPILILSRRVLDKDFTSVSGKVYLGRNDFWDEPDAGAKLLRMCRLAQSRDLRISLELQRAIKTHLDVITDAVRHDRALGRVFLEILGDAGKVQPILADMHNAGLLGAYLPEFGNLTCHMQFDSYHQYTVDEHTLIAVGNLDAVAREELPGLQGMRRIFPELKRKDLLVLGLLLHDMGKYMGRGHVARGALMVSPVAKRLGLDAAEEELVYFLVERHVVLSDASRMRDFHEPGFLRAFAEKIGNQFQLDMLYCLTYADAKAVGEGILTGWQEALLAEIRQAVDEQFAQAKGAPAVGHHERLRQELVKSGIAADQADAYLRDFSDSYSYQALPGEVLRHFKVLEEVRRDGVGLSHELKDKYVYLVAAVPDRHALFADVAATLSGHGFDIIDARTWISHQGLVLYNYRLSSIYPNRLREAELWKRLRQDLLLVAQGKLQAEGLLAKRRNALGLNKPADSRFDDPAVKVEQRTSDAHTIVDIHTKDEPGLLSKLCRAISGYGCEISHACINTMGDVAVDVFYVDRGGKKLEDTDAEGLRQHLIASLNLAPAAVAS